MTHPVAMQGFRDSPLEALVGNTPLVDLSTFTPDGVALYAKLEAFNPGGSVKDRAALRIVRDAIQRGELRPGRSLLDATSGNTGIAYAWLGAAKGFEVTLCVSEGVSPARKSILNALGAHLEWTDPAEGSDGAIRRARELATSDPERYWYADQYNNPGNVQAHVETTGPEIWEQTQGRVTHVVMGLGTTGTLMGVAQALKERNPDIRAIGVEPDQALHGLEGMKHLPTAIVPGIYDAARLDGTLRVRSEDAYAACRRLAAETGLLVGTSSGAAFHAALETARELSTATIVTLFPDSGDKYLDTPAWRRP